MNLHGLGKRGEDAAARWYAQQGYAILARNYHSRFGEIDLIAEQDGCLVFAEVKARSEGAPVGPAEAVDARKQGRILRTAMCYLQQQCLGERLMRFDVVEIVLGRDGKLRLRCHQNAFS